MSCLHKTIPDDEAKNKGTLLTLRTPSSAITTLINEWFPTTNGSSNQWRRSQGSNCTPNCQKLSHVLVFCSPCSPSFQVGAPPLQQMKTYWKKRNQMDIHARSDNEEVVGGRSQGFNRALRISELKNSKIQNEKTMFMHAIPKIAVILTNNIEMSVQMSL